MITLSLNILDIVQNSVRAKATEIFIGIRESCSKDLYEITVRDNGCGIPEKILDQVTDPFFTTRKVRKTGLGLPLLSYHANLSGGNLKIDSKEGEGTKVTATFSLSDIDRQPLGDICGVITMLIAASPEINFIYSHTTDSGSYSFSSEQTKEFLCTETLNEGTLLPDIREMIGENLRAIGVSDLITQKND